MRTVAIVQARMGSTRLPGKALADIDGQPMLQRVLNRTVASGCLDGVIVATTMLPQDDEIVDFCEQGVWRCFRGSPTDLLDRYYQAARIQHPDAIVRITSDCPLMDPDVIRRVVETFRATPGLDYVDNSRVPPRTFPYGLDVEVMSFDALERAWREDRNPAWREHVTPYFYHRPELFHVGTVRNEIDLSDMRWTVDTPEDLAFVRAIYDRAGADIFPMAEVLRILDREPWLESINCDIQQKAVA